MNCSKDKKFLFFSCTQNFLHFLVYFIPVIILACLFKIYVATRYVHLVPLLFKYFIMGALAFVGMLIIIPLCSMVARKFNIVKKPGGFKSHFAPVPMLGGLGIFLSFLTVAWLEQPWTPQMTAIIIGSSIIMVIGTIDDIWPLSSIVRLIGQIAAASIVMAEGLRISIVPVDTFWGGVLSCVITLIWILGIINATNFVDGVDGLAAGFTVIASFFFFLITLHLHQFSVALVAAILIGCGLGFLIFNFKPAKIYLGDGGSTFLGFMLACLAIHGEWSSWGPIVALGIPVLILGVLIFDMIYITLSRIRNGHVRNFRQWLDYRGEDHFHHRLIKLGFKEEYAVLFIYFTSVILGLSALVIEHARVSFPVVVVLVQAGLIFINISILMLIGRKNSSDAATK